MERDINVQPTDLFHTRDELAAVLDYEREWFERLRSAAQAYLDRPNPVTLGKLKRIVAAASRRDTR